MEVRLLNKTLEKNSKRFGRNLYQCHTTIGTRESKQVSLELGILAFQHTQLILQNYGPDA